MCHIETESYTYENHDAHRRQALITSIESNYPIGESDTSSASPTAQHRDLLPIQIRIDESLYCTNFSQHQAENIPAPRNPRAPPPWFVHCCCPLVPGGISSRSWHSPNRQSWRSRCYSCKKITIHTRHTHMCCRSP